MAGQIELRGSIIRKDDACNGSGANVSHPLAPPGSCASRYYQSLVEATDVNVATLGAIGDAFVSIDEIVGLDQIEFLFIRTSAEMIVRLDATPATALAVGATYPTGFAGGETLTVTRDAETLVTVTFDAADQSVAQVAARINAAFALASTTGPASVSGGQLLFTGIATSDCGDDVAGFAFGGTEVASLGLSAPTEVEAGGRDVRLHGIMLIEFPRTSDAPSAIEISGSGSFDILAAGRRL